MKLNFKRWFLATVGGFIVIVAGDFLVHNVWLTGFYQAHPMWWRSPAAIQTNLHFMLVGQLLLATLLVLVYAQGYEAKRGTASQGFRFGMLMSILLSIPHNLIVFAVYPYPLWLILRWVIGELLTVSAACTVIGYFYRPAE